MAGIRTFVALEMFRFRLLNCFLTYIQMFTIICCTLCGAGDEMGLRRDPKPIVRREADD